MGCFVFLIFDSVELLLFISLWNNLDCSLEALALGSTLPGKKIKSNEKMFFLGLGFCHRELKRGQRKLYRNLDTLLSVFFVVVEKRINS